MTKPISALFMPKWDEANPYQRLLRKGLESNGVGVQLADYGKGLLPISSIAKNYKLKESSNILHLHWMSPVFMRIAWSNNPFVFALKTSLLWLDLVICKLIGFKIVWTIHNKVAHEGGNKKKELKLRRLLFNQSSQVIVHSHQAIDVLSSLYGLDMAKKANVIEHGHYVGVYPKPSDSRLSLRHALNIDENKTVYLFFGAVKPYKGVENFIQAANECANDHDLIFIIAGEVVDPNYENTLRKMVMSERLMLDFSFLSDQSLIDTIELADAIVLPFADTLTSGSLLLAMSQSKAVVMSAKGKVFGCVTNDYPLFFENQKELVGLLKNNEKRRLEIIGESNLKQIQNNTWERVGAMTMDAYLS